MTRAAWTSGALSAAELKGLAEDLSKVLPYTATSQEVFVGLVDEAIAEFRDPRQPDQQDLLARKERVKQVAAASRKLAAAIAGLDGGSEDLIELSAWAAEGKAGEVPVGLVSEASSIAARVEAGAQYWIDHPSGRIREKNKAAIEGFIGELGRAYLAAFHERPAGSPGTFWNVLNLIFPVASVDLRCQEQDEDPAVQSINKTRLNRIIHERVLGGPKPRPGRKKRAVK